MYRRSAAEKPRKDSAGFFDFGREKVSVCELSDDFGTACGPFLLVGETVVSRQPQQTANAVCFCVYAVKSCAQYAVPFTTVQPMPMVVKLLLRMFARWPDELIHDWTTASGVL